MKKNGIAAIIFLSAFIVVLLNVVVWVLGSVVVGLISTAVSLFVYAIFLSAVDKVNKSTLCDCGEKVSEAEIVTDDNDICNTENNVESKDNVVCYVIVDNYSDVFNGISANEAGKLTIEIEEKMAELAEYLDGVVHKLERDRFVLFYGSGSLAIQMADKVAILNSIKNIRGTNGISVTLSIGIGCSGKSVSKSASFAKSAAELALGRGGDQAVVKNGDEFRFFGGTTRETEKKTGVRARVMAQSLCSIISNFSQVIIMGHKNPDADSFGACVGIFRIAESIGVRARIVMDGTNTAVVRENEQFRQMKEYDFAFVSCDKALGIINEKTVIVVVDTHVAGRVEIPELLNLTSSIVVIDHHRQSADFIRNTLLTYHEPSASSASEMVTGIIQYTDFASQLLKYEAEALFAGIALDTKNFTQKTGVRTFDAAAFLRKCGADTGAVKELFKNDIEDHKKLCSIVASAECYRGITVISGSHNAATEICARAADELLNIRDIKASFVLSSAGERIHISARSTGDINVQLIAEMLGGGGHMTVAGVQLDCTMDEAVDSLKKTIDRYFTEFY